MTRMEVLAVVAVVVLVLNVMVVSLCVTAKRADEIGLTVPVPTLERPARAIVDPGWVATIATPAEKPARTSAGVRLPQHH